MNTPHPTYESLGLRGGLDGMGGLGSSLSAFPLAFLNVRSHLGVEAGPILSVKFENNIATDR